MTPLFVLFVGFVAVGAQWSPLQIHKQGDPSKKISPSAPQPPVIGGLKEYKLNDTWIPSHYDLNLTIILEEGDEGDLGEELTAPGTVAIQFVPKLALDYIVLHSHPDFVVINTTSVTVQNLEDEADIIETKSITWSNDDRQFVTVQLNKVLAPDIKHKIVLDFIAPISNTRTNGLFLTNYTDPRTGQVKRVAATQMEPLRLRQVFPSFDEPGLKATFNVTINHRSNYSVLANAPLDKVEPHSKEGWSVSRFEPTVKMSTYLFALVVSDFSYSQANADLSPVDVRVWAAPHLIKSGGGDYSADITAKLLDFFDEYFNTTYPFSKMDSAALTHKGGAMENWGLILYGTDFLIYFPGETLETVKNNLVNTVSHEVAHQNFGNLVTCKWWSDLWLNEGFATYLSYLGVDAVAPEFANKEWFINDAFQTSLLADAGPSSHPLHNEDVLNPDQVDAQFSTITYPKGASINKMTEAFLTESTFKKGLQYYLQNMEYQGAVQDDLFQSLDKAAEEDGRELPASVKNILDTWTLQKSHPLVRVSVAAPDSVFISQERYVDSSSSELWYVPITVVTQDTPTIPDHAPALWLESNVTLQSWKHETSKWIMVNADATGYFRVLYDGQLTSLIQQQLLTNSSVISPLSRSQLLDDYFYLAFKGFVSLETALNLTLYLEEEDHFTVWNVVFNQFLSSFKFIENEAAFSVFQNYLLPKVEAALQRVGLREEKVGALQIFRSKLLDWACSMGHKDSIMFAHDLHTQWEANLTNNPIPVDIQATIFCAIVSSGGQDELDFILQRYKEETLPAIKTRLLHALACASNETLIQSVLALTLDPNSGLDTTQSLTLLYKMAANAKGRTSLLSFLNTNLQDIIDVVGKGSVAVVEVIVGSLSTHLSTQAQLDNVLSFIAENAEQFTEIDAELNIYVNVIRSNINWMNQWGQPILAWMEQNAPTADDNNKSAAHSVTSHVPFLILTLLTIVWQFD